MMATARTEKFHFWNFLQKKKKNYRQSAEDFIKPSAEDVEDIAAQKKFLPKLYFCIFEGLTINFKEDYMMSYHTLPEDGHPVIITHFILSLLALYALISIWAYHHLDIPFDSPDAVTTRFHEWLLAFALAIPLLFPFACYNDFFVLLITERRFM